jgi:Spy/CpxP family protein refolding chaperone
MQGRMRAALVIGAIVIGSALAGAAIDRTVLVRTPPRRVRMSRGAELPTPEQEAKRRQEGLDRMTKDLHLLPAQRAAIDSIMQRTDSSLRVIRVEMQPRLRRVFDSSRAEISARLDSAQKVKFAENLSRKKP